jgi:hypothetical protein
VGNKVVNIQKSDSSKFWFFVSYSIVNINLEQRFDEEENFALLKQLKVSIKINCQFQEL